MKTKSITVTEAARNFADCINRAHYQKMTFVLLKNGEPFARLVPDNEKACVGRDLAEVLAKTNLPENEARAWHHDLKDRKSTRLNSSHGYISYAVFCLKKKQHHRVLLGAGMHFRDEAGIRH